MKIKYKDYLCPYCDQWGMSKEEAIGHSKLDHTIAREIEFEDENK